MSVLKRSLKAAARYRYEAIAALNGAIIMVLEIVGARIIAPHFGSSVYVWTAVIGVILGAMSAGYWYGGKLADRGATDRGLGRLLVLAGAVLLVSLLSRELSLAVATAMGSDIRWQALVAAILLFAPANVLMGMVSPYIAKLKIASLDTAGASVGRLYAAGTLGSIIGTFAAGYWLIALMGNQALGLCLVVALVVASLIADPHTRLDQRFVTAGAALVLWLAPGMAGIPVRATGVLYDGDSAYARWKVSDTEYKGRPARILTADSGVAQSGIYVDQPDVAVFRYVDSLLQVAKASGEPMRVLLIGGGTYTLPRMLTQEHPDMAVDVVEIDPKLDELAERYFGFKPNGRVRTIHQDGRTFLNANQNKYDLVLIDAFSAVTPPFQLTTSEAVGRVADSVTPNGIVAVNLIGAMTGNKSHFAQAEYSTYAAHFKEIAVVQSDLAKSPAIHQNLILIAGQYPDKVDAVGAALGSTGTKMPLSRILTDDYAPVEQLNGFYR